MPVTFIGHKADESLVSITFMTDGIIEGLPPMAGFERLVFPPEFTDLLRVDITSTSYSLDNLVVKVPSLPPAVRLTGPGEGARFSAGFDVIVGVQATETDNPIVRVQVFAGDNLIGEFSDTACRGLRADGKGHRQSRFGGHFGADAHSGASKRSSILLYVCSGAGAGRFTARDTSEFRECDQAGSAP